MDRWEKHSQEEGQPRRKSEGRREEVEKIRDGESQKKQVCEKVGKSRNIVFFHGFVAPEGRKIAR